MYTYIILLYCMAWSQCPDSFFSSLLWRSLWSLSRLWFGRFLFFFLTLLGCAGCGLACIMLAA